MPGIGIITNPNSKANKRDPSKSDLLGFILGQQGQLAVTRSLEHLHQVAHNFKASNIEILAINGGDGTISRTLTAFVQAYGSDPLPKIALLRGGTMNVLASNLSIRGSPERLLFNLVESYSAGRLSRTTLLQSLEVEGHLGFLYADGLAYRVLEEFYQNKTNTLGVLFLVSRLIGSALVHGEMAKRLITHQNVQISAEGFGSRELSNCMIFASSIDRMPLGLRLFPHARTSPGRFQFIGVTSHPDSLLFDLPKIIGRSELGEIDQRVSFCSPELRIISDKKYDYSLDGELYTRENAGVTTIKAGPRFEFITPN
jgi:diacylglycerol kinase family enzyme